MTITQIMLLIMATPVLLGVGYLILIGLLFAGALVFGTVRGICIVLYQMLFTRESSNPPVSRSGHGIES